LTAEDIAPAAPTTPPINAPVHGSIDQCTATARRLHQWPFFWQLAQPFCGASVAVPEPVQLYWHWVLH